jgi:transposase
VQRVGCSECQAVRQVKIRFAGEHKRYTRVFERLILDLSRQMTIQAVARYLGVSWDLVKEILSIGTRRVDQKSSRFQRQYAQTVFQNARCSPLRYPCLFRLRWPINRPLESTNNKIKTLHKMAYGFRDIEFFKLKIMALHETNYTLVGGA